MAEPQAPQENILVRLNRETGLILFPPEVIALHEQGKARAAYKLFRKHVKAADDLSRQQLAPYLEQTRLWLDPLRRAPGMATVNGIGTKLYGKYKPQSDGTYIATLWFVVLFIPIWPLAAYLVLPAKRGWHFLAKAPFPPAARVVRTISAMGALVLAAAFGGSMLLAALYTDVYAYNGFDEPVVVQIGEEAHTIPAHQPLLYEGVRVGRVPFATRTADGRTLEELEQDIAPGGKTLLYNAAGRGVLVVEEVVYGNGNPAAPQFIAGSSFEALRKVDYPFQQPPPSKSVEAGSSLHNRVLSSAEQELGFTRSVIYLQRQGRTDDALRLVRSELSLHPDNFYVAALGNWIYELRPDEGRRVFKRWIEENPDNVEMHRMYQDVFDQLGDEEHAEMVEEYRRAADQHPDSTAHAYLYARALDDRDAALAQYHRALQLDEGNLSARRGLAYNLAAAGEVAEAVAEYAELAEKGGPHWAASIWREQLRLARVQGAGEHDPAFRRTVAALQADDGIPIWAVEQVQAQRRELQATLDRITVQRQPAALLNVLGSYSADVPEADQPYLELELALVAGDAARARRVLRQDMTDADELAQARAAALIAMLPRATAEDVKLAFDTHGQSLPGLRFEDLLLVAAAARSLAPDQADALSKAAQAAAPHGMDPEPILDGGAALHQVGTVDALMASWPAEYRGIGYAAAFWAVQNVPHSQAARAHFQRAARAWALPSEAPCL